LDRADNLGLMTEQLDDPEVVSDPIEAVIEPEIIPADVELPVDDYVDIDSNPQEDTKSASREIARQDPLDLYLRELKAYPHLSKEEEFSLAKEYKEYQDLQAAFKLVTSNLWLVVKIARDYERAAKNLLDLIQEGNIGLMEAVKNFDPYRGVRFPSYAVWWIKAYIVRFLIANWRMVKIGTTQAQRKLFFNLKKEQEKLEREGFYAAPKLLAERLNVKENEVLEMQQRMGSADLSVDAPQTPGESDSSLLSLLPAQQEGAEELLFKHKRDRLFREGVEEFLATLNSKEVLIFNKRLLSEDKHTLHELSEEINLSKERVRQVENRLREKFKQFLIDKFGDEIIDFVS
jgi:RNA polymerase sigma-32 factor